MKKKLAVLATEDDLIVDLTFHNVPASLLTEFAEKIVIPYYAGNVYNDCVVAADTCIGLDGAIGELNFSLP